MNKRTILPAVGIVVASSVFATPLVATASTTSAAASSQQSVETWRTIDWNDIAKSARASGDRDGAVAALQVRDGLVSMESRRAESQVAESRSLWTALAKKAVVEVLKHASSKLPAKIRPYAMKIVGVIEEINSFQQTAVVTALTHAGIPYDVSVATAQWIVFFLGL